MPNMPTIDEPMTIVQTVERWYEGNLERLRPNWREISIRACEAADPVHGQVEIRVESDSQAASITFWNKGDVCVLRLALPEKRDSVIDDRVTSPSESIERLLESYFERLAARSR
jgi:hypothetical protein